MGADDLVRGRFPGLEAGGRRAVAAVGHLGGRLRRFATAHPTAARLAGAGAVFVGTVLITVTSDAAALTPAALAVAVVVSASFVVVPALGWPRWLILATATAGTMAETDAADSPARPALILAMVLYSLNAEKAAAITATAAVSLALGSAGSVVAAVQGRLELENVAVMPWVVAAAAVGQAVRANRARRAMLEERALRAEQGREDEARRRVQAERLRIARELHDAVGHQVALSNVQAGALSVLLDAVPPAGDRRAAQAREALEHIQTAGEAALDELRLAVGLLRQPGEPEPVEPAGRLSRLDDLIASFTAAGLRVTCDVTGPVRPLPDAVDLTVYRLIQESLTNTAKHAAGTTAAIRLTFSAGTLALAVEDEGPPHSAGAQAQAATDGDNRATGHGIIGMRERATALGGRLTAAPRPGGGFRVTAELPVPAGATT